MLDTDTEADDGLMPSSSLLPAPSTRSRVPRRDAAAPGRCQPPQQGEQAGTTQKRMLGNNIRLRASLVPRQGAAGTAAGDAAGGSASRSAPCRQPGRGSSAALQAIAI